MQMKCSVFNAMVLVNLALFVLVLQTVYTEPVLNSPEDEWSTESSSTSDEVSYFMDDKIAELVNGANLDNIANLDLDLSHQDSQAHLSTKTPKFKTIPTIQPSTTHRVPTTSASSTAYKRVCVYPNWSVQRESLLARIYPEDIDPFLCTHIHYAFANIDIKTFDIVPSQIEDHTTGLHGLPLYNRILALREKNPELKILISIGGWFAKSTPFNLALTSNLTRAVFIQKIVSFLKRWNFDGIDIQWIYPGSMEFGATADSREKFSSFLRHLSKAFRTEHSAGFKKYMISAQVASDEYQIDSGYQVKKVCKYLDYVSLATYDYTGLNDFKTGYNSPLYSASITQPSANHSIHFWLDRGCPARKILIGVPTYGRGFKIMRNMSTAASINSVYLGVDARPLTSPSVYTNEEGILSYYEVCEIVYNNRDTKLFWDDMVQVPFAIITDANENAGSTEYDLNQRVSSMWISYEDARSGRKKASYVKENGLGGVSLWSLDMDDFRGAFCRLGKFPILRSIMLEFDNNDTTIEEIARAEETTTTTTTTTTRRTTTSRARSSTIDWSFLFSTTKRVPSFLTMYPFATLPKFNKTSMTSKATKQPTGVYSINNKRKFNFSFLDLDWGLLSSLESRLKNFKAVREVKVTACLDNQICGLHAAADSTSITFNIYLLFFTLFIVLFYC